MSRMDLSRASILASAAVVATVAAGCERPSETPGGRAAAMPAARVEVVHPERRTVRRTVGQPGQLQAFETAEVHARVPGYVKGWTVNIVPAVKKGQVLAELSAPELEADLGQKEAAVEQAVANRKQAEAAVEVASADVAGSQAKLAEVRAGVARAEADVARWRSEFHRVEELFAARCRPAACSTRPGTSSARPTPPWKRSAPT